MTTSHTSDHCSSLRQHLWAVALSLAASAATAAGTATLTAKQPAPFRADLETATVDLSLTLPDKVEAADVQVQLQQVQFSAPNGPLVTRHFSVQPALRAAANRSPAVRVDVQDIATLRPGEYTLTLGLSGSGGSALGTLAATLERPAARLEPPGKLTVDLLMAHAWSYGASAGPSALALEPAAEPRWTALRHASVDESGFHTAAGLWHPGRLNLTVVGAASAASARQPLRLQMQPSDFPLGTSTGKFTIRSDDLAAPMTVEVDVRTRIAAGWITLIVALGAFTGWLLRNRLQPQADLATASAAATQRLLEWRTRYDQIEDRDFRARLDPAVRQLARLLEGRDSAAIQQQVVVLKDLLAAAETALKARVDEAGTALLALRRLDVGTGTLPPDLAAAVQAALATCDRASTACRRNPGLALELLASARTRLQSQLTVAWAGALFEQKAWHSACAAVLVFLDPARHPDRQIDPAAAPAVGDTPQQPAGIDDLGALAKALDGWRALGEVRRRLLRQWAEYLRVDTDSAVALLRLRLAGKTEALPALDSFKQALDTLAAQVEAASAPAHAFAAPSWALAPAQAVARELVMQLRGLVNDDPDTRQQLDSALASGAYATAIQAYLAMDILLKEGEAPTRTTDRVVTADAAVANSLQPDEPEAPPSLSAAALDHLARTFDARQQSLEWQIAACVGTVYVLASYAMFKGRFVGTADEVAALFFWGFALDLSITRLTTQAGTWAAKVTP